MSFKFFFSRGREAFFFFFFFFEEKKVSLFLSSFGDPLSKKIEKKNNLTSRARGRQLPRLPQEIRALADGSHHIKGVFGDARVRSRQLDVLVGIVERRPDQRAHAPVDDDKLLLPVLLDSRHLADQCPGRGHHRPPGLDDKRQIQVGDLLPHRRDQLGGRRQRRAGASVVYPEPAADVQKPQAGVPCLADLADELDHGRRGVAEDVHLGDRRPEVRVHPGEVEALVRGDLLQEPRELGVADAEF